MRIRSLALAALVACATSTAFTVGAEATSSRRSHSVVLKDIAFSPSRTTIKRGESVTFTWRDGSTKHNVTYASGKRFKGASTRGSGSYTVKFSKRGTYKYQCTLHLGMTGTITVR